MADDDWYDNRFDRYVTAVGRIAGIWAQLEFVINDAIWELANVDLGAGACITAQIIPSGSRTRALISLVHYRGARQELLTDLNRLSNDIEDLGRQRNRFIHDPASLNRETGEISRVNVTADRRLDFSFHPVDYDRMASFQTKIKMTITRFRDLYNRVLVDVPPWQEHNTNDLVKGFAPGRLHKTSPSKCMYAALEHFSRDFDFIRGRASRVRVSGCDKRIATGRLFVCHVHSCPSEVLQRWRDPLGPSVE